MKAIKLRYRPFLIDLIDVHICIYECTRQKNSFFFLFPCVQANLFPIWIFSFLLFFFFSLWSYSLSIIHIILSTFFYFYIHWNRLQSLYLRISSSYIVISDRHFYPLIERSLIRSVTRHSYFLLLLFIWYDSEANHSRGKDPDVFY